MSSLDKLQIQGIRSFGPESPQTIKFFTPLTLIVGYNGSGKTTIIECLKYATTGETPPNTKGGAFIHDLKLLGSSDIKAQVKLQFWDTNGARMVASRRQQMTQKKVKREVKTIDATLFTARNGEKTSLTSRLIELDLIVPQYLGVSKAILENVIFCHQDDSLWPLSEPGVLKKKFDEIFEAQKYTKAIDNIKSLRKHQNEELAKFKIIETNAKQDKDKAIKLERRCTEYSNEIEELREQANALTSKIDENNEKAQFELEKTGSFEASIGRIVTLRNQQQFLQQRLDQLGQDLEKSNESDEWLQAQLDSQQQRLESYHSRREECHNRYSQVKQEIDQFRGQQDTKRTEAGTYKEQKRAHENRVQDRQQLIKTTAREHNVHGYDTDLDDVQIEEFMDRIAKISKDQTSKVEKLRRENAEESKKIQDILDELLEKRTEAQQGKNYAKGQVSENDRKIASLQQDLNRITSDEGGKAVIEGNIDEVQCKLAKAREEYDGADWPKRFDTMKSQVNQREEKVEALNRELIESTNQSTSLARLDHLKKDSKDKQTNLTTLLTTYGDQLKRLIEHEIEPGTVEDEVAQVIDHRNNELKAAQKKRDGATQQLRDLDYKREQVKASIKDKLAEMAKHAQTVSDAINDEPEHYPEILLECQTNRDTRAEDVQSFQSVKKWYDDCIKAAKSRNCCRVCERDFNSQEQVELFIRKLVKRTDEEMFGNLKTEYNDLNQQLTAAQDARGSYDIWLRIKNEEKPRLQKEQEEANKKRVDVMKAVNEHEATVRELEEAKSEAESKSKIAGNIARAKSELDKVERQVAELLQNQSQDIKLRPLTDVKDDLDSVNREARELRSEQSKLQTDEKRAKDKMASHELELSNAKSRLITANADLERKTAKLAQIEDLKQSSQQQRTAVTKNDDELQRIEPRLREEQSRLSDMRRKGQNREAELQREANDIMNSLNLLTNADREIRFYLEQGGPTKLAQCEREIEVLERNISNLESEQKQVTGEVNRIQNELSNADNLKRVYTDNLKFREAQREYQRNEVDLREEEDKDPEAEQAKHRREYDRARRYLEAYTLEQTSKKAMMKAKDVELARYLKEYEDDYSDAAKKYKRAHIEVETTKAAVEDLGRYGGALDKAIMKFHSLKMEEINQIVDELWKKTYQGTDVDTILIRSDNETAKGNRSYNYRVCMVKQGAEMDMRGRCSAGQRVLASIIIRLALAECFGVNCGMIALDEPTTNLDRDNIRSLAESLHDIIDVRKHQKNFQLIVITHDEEFLRHMHCSEFAEEYYRVRRDADQRSVIEKQNVGLVMGD